jgi:hypothetical protein
MAPEDARSLLSLRRAAQSNDLCGLSACAASVWNPAYANCYMPHVVRPCAPVFGIMLHAALNHSQAHDSYREPCSLASYNPAKRVVPFSINTTLAITCRLVPFCFDKDRGVKCQIINGRMRLVYAKINHNKEI